MCKRIIDWDDVSAVPIKLLAIGNIAEFFFLSDPTYSLGLQNAHFFQSELTRIERQKSSSTKLPHVSTLPGAYISVRNPQPKCKFSILAMETFATFGGNASGFIRDHCYGYFGMGRILQFLLYK
jgi:hypothetical protein